MAAIAGVCSPFSYRLVSAGVGSCYLVQQHMSNKNRGIIDGVSARARTASMTLSFVAASGRRRVSAGPVRIAIDAAAVDCRRALPRVRSTASS